MSTRLSLVLLLLVTLSACTGTMRETRTQIEVRIASGHYSPAQWRVPAGQTITLQLINMTQEDHTWVLLTDPPTEPFDANDEALLLQRFPLAAGETRTVTFTSPAAPGEYSVTCARPGHLENGEIGKMVVVQPGY
jgi:plastocyanin